MKPSTSIQYTIRKVPPRIDQTLRERSRATGQSINQVALDALTKGLGLGNEKLRYKDMDDLAGTWVEDPDFDKIIEDQQRIDPELWKNVCE